MTTGHIRLTSHSGGADAPGSIGAQRQPKNADPSWNDLTRGHRNVIGTHSGSYSVYRALAVAAGALSRDHRADLTNTSPPTTSARTRSGAIRRRS